MKKLKSVDTIIFLLIITILALTLFIAFNLDKLAQDSGHLIKVYWQAEH